MKKFSTILTSCAWGFISLNVLASLFMMCQAQVSFVETRGTEFVVNGSPFLFNGFNSYWMMTMAAQPSERFKISNALRDAAAAGLTVCRTWAFSDGGPQALQMSPGVYNEAVFQVSYCNFFCYVIMHVDHNYISVMFWCLVIFQGLDFVVSEARKYAVKLILSLSNNYKDYGGKAQYVEWARSGGVPVSGEDDFYTNAVVKGYYKSHVKVRTTTTLDIASSFVNFSDTFANFSVCRVFL